jgi:FKBP-type peptidyl-prolyl cis-trans isomerase (trigger factor)
LTILPSGNFNIQFEYEIKPEFSIPLEDSDFIKDYQKFPRSKDYIPEWLRVILERNQIS